MCWATIHPVENEVPYTLKILNIHLGLVHHKFELIKIQVVVSLVAADFWRKDCKQQALVPCAACGKPLIISLQTWPLLV